MMDAWKTYQLVWMFFVAFTLDRTCGKTASEWKTRIIYQLLTDRFSHSTQNPNTTCSNLRRYCGGTFRGIENNLDYIQGLGANAIWISPFVLNTDLGYHGYWAKDLYQVNPEFGSRDDLLSLIKTCHNRDVWVMMDVVANHMGYPGGCFWDDRCDGQPDKMFNVTEFVPFDQKEHYHPLCHIDWSAMNFTQIENCWLGKLPDLNQKNPYVRRVLLDWIGNLTVDYGFDGYRIDTVVEVPHDFWAEFQEAAGMFCIGEANLGSVHTEYVSSYQGALDSLLNFPVYWALRKVFNERAHMTEMIERLTEQRRYFQDTTVLGQFLDNHDFPRFLNLTKNVPRLKNALAYVILSEGIPIIYYGTEQLFYGGNDPNNRESLWPHHDTESVMYKFIKRLTSVRKETKADFSSGNQVEHYVDMDTLAFSRSGKEMMLVVISSSGSAETFTKHLRRFSGFINGTKFRNTDWEETLALTDNGLQVKFYNGEPQIYTVIVPHCPAGNSPTISQVHGVFLVITFISAYAMN